MPKDELIAALEKADGEDNALDVLCEVALFEPSPDYIAIRPNNAGTKVIYTRTNGREETCWALPFSNPMNKAATIAALRATERGEAGR